MATRREGPGLRRGVGLGMLASILIVNLAAAVFVSLGVVADEALGATPAVFVVGGIIFLVTMLGYIEGVTMLPQAGGAAGFARQGLGELPSFFAAWALILDYVIMLLLTATFAVHYLGSLPGAGRLLEGPVDVVVTIVFVLAVAALTVRGVKAGAALSIAVSAVALVAQLLLAVIGFVVLFEPGLIGSTLDLGTTPTWGALVYALPIAAIGFTGLDSVANLGGELDKPGRDIPRPMIWSAVTSVVVFVVMSVVALNAVPVRGSGSSAVTQLGSEQGWVERPVIGIIDALGGPAILEASLRTVFGLLAAIVLFLAASTALAALGRVTYFMSLHRQVPSALFAVDRSTGTPRAAIVVVTVFAIALLAMLASVGDRAVVLAQVYAFGATLTATIAGVALLRLRYSEPELPRPFRAPLNVDIGGTSISVAIVLGTLGAFATWLIVVFTHDAARVVGLTWMVFGFVGFGTYRLTHGLPIRSHVLPRETKTPHIEARTYRRVLVAVRPTKGMLAGAGDAELMGLAHKLVDTDEGAAAPEIAVMFVHELPLTEPLDAPLGEAEASTMRRLAKIRAAADTLGLRISSTVTRGRAAGRAICQEAERRDADAVLLAMRTKPRRGDEVFGRSVAYVVRHAPCDVVVLSLPEESLVDARARR